MAKTVIRTRDKGNYFLGEVEVPLDGGARVTCRALGAFPWEAIKKATSVATRIVTDPALQPFLPPQATLAIQAARKVAQLAKDNPALLNRIAPAMAPASKALAQSFLKRIPAPYRGAAPPPSPAQDRAQARQDQSREHRYAEAIRRFDDVDDVKRSDTAQQEVERYGGSDADEFFDAYEENQANGFADEPLPED